VNGSIKRGKSVGCPACKDERGTESSQHVGFTIVRASPAGQAQSGPELTDPRPHITDISKDDPGSLVRYRRRIGTGTRRQRFPRPGQRLMRTGHRQRQQVVHVAIPGPGCRRAFHHEQMLDPRIRAVEFALRDKGLHSFTQPPLYATNTAQIVITLREHHTALQK
jgi:hypothetical protein